MAKTLSISVAAYNIQKYIHKLMDSLIQSDCIDDLEILIIDDGSIDNTTLIAQEYEKAYPESIKVISKENGGHGSTINKGIENATGKYFRSIDGDDWVNSQNLRELVSKLKKIEVDMIICDYDKCYPDHRIDTQVFDNIEPMKLYNIDDALKEIQWMCYHTILYRTDILKENHIEIDEHCFYVDTEYDLYPIPYIKTLVYFNKPVYCYRLGIEGQSVSPESRKKHLDHGYTVANSLLKLCDRQIETISESKKNYILFGVADFCMWHIRSMFMFEASARWQKDIKAFDSYVKNQSLAVYEKMEDFGSESTMIRILRASDYKLYWIIKKYKTLRNK